METDIAVNSAVARVDTSDGKRQKSSTNELEDRISNLPDSILSHILSLLPTRDAVKTVLLSRFGHLWTSTHTLVFDRCSYHVCADDDNDNEDEENRFLKFIRHALILHARPTIYKFSLKFAFGFSEEWHRKELREIQDDEDYINEMQLANEIDTWISFAVRREVKILNVDVRACRDIDLECCYKLPKFVLNSCYLTELSLVSCALNPGRKVHMTSLKILSLSEIKVSDELMDTILSGCPLLEDLSLTTCPGLRNLNFTSPCSKKLELFYVARDNVSKLVISCPTVTSLTVNGWLECMELRNVSSVVDAKVVFSIGFRGDEKGYLEILRLFRKLHHAKTLAICTWCVLVFTIWKVTNIPCPYFDWKCVELDTVLSKRYLHGIENLLRSCPYLETFNIRVWSGKSSLAPGEGMWLDAYDFDEENYWDSLEAFDCLTNYLKTVNISGKINHPCVIQMVKFLLKSSLVLEKLVIRTKQDNEPQWSERLLEYSQKLASFPRASSRSVILFVKSH